MTNPSTPTSTTIHRPLGGLTGYRIVYDRASRVAIHAFPMADLATVAATGLLTGVCAYALVGGGKAYIGESGRPGRRLAEHAADQAKSFARDAFLVMGDGSQFDKSLALDFQYRLTRRAVEAGAVMVAKGADPVSPSLAAADRATHDRIYNDALRLLHDAGCTAFRERGPADAEAAAPTPAAPPAPDECEDARDGGPLTIDVSTVPLGSAEFELRYLGLWARGYQAGDRFVVAAGSEVRAQPNDSIDRLTKRRHDQLCGAGVLAPIPAVADRRRLVVAVAFPTPSVAAKVLCGAHTPSKWIPLEPAKAVWLAE
jgi:hypothetical protein